MGYRVEGDSSVNRRFRNEVGSALEPHLGPATRPRGRYSMAMKRPEAFLPTSRDCTTLGRVEPTMGQSPSSDRTGGVTW